MTKDHSLECKNLEIKIPKILSEIKKWEDCRDKCFNYLENTEKYDNKYLISKFNDIYKKEEYTFSLDDK